MTISQLSEVFSRYDIYAQNRYKSSDCPLRVFQRMYPNSSYSSDIDVFLQSQPSVYTGDGADLPWWGDRYFSNDQGVRVMILSQDSRTPNGGSVTFYMPLIADIEHNTSNLLRTIRSYNHWDPFVSFNLTRNFLARCQFNYDFIYVTDARKIGKGWENLLEREIEVVKPDIIICLGNKGLSYLTNLKNPGITRIIDESDDIVLYAHDNVLRGLVRKPIIVPSLFPSRGNGHYTTEREDKVVETINKLIKEMQGTWKVI
jgi:hypothetical protein